MNEPAFSPEPRFPQIAEFYRRVLDELPSPTLVVDHEGTIVYGNRALRHLGGWDVDGYVGTNALTHIHPDDAEAMTATFVDLTDGGGASQFEEIPWASVNMRLVAASGQPVPVTVKGVGGLDEPGVNAIIYDIQPAHEQYILRQGLVGLAQGQPIDSILELITSMISLPPLDLDAAVLESTSEGSYNVIGATNPVLREILARAEDPQPWNSAPDAPIRTPVSQIPGDIGEDLFAAGYREFWHTAPSSEGGPSGHRIVACGRTFINPSTGQQDRLARANELASVVLLRARADALLEHAATHDQLTQLPNREGFQRTATERLETSTSTTAALLFLDLDGFKEVNDQHGHAAGDVVLATIARRLEAVTRSVDLVGRLGGDEFVVLVGATTDRPANYQRVSVVCNRALEELRRSIDIDGATVRVAASIGAAIAQTPIDLESLVATADSAMYEAKNSSGDSFHIVELQPDEPPESALG